MELSLRRDFRFLALLIQVRKLIFELFSLLAAGTHSVFHVSVTISLLCVGLVAR